MYKKTLTTFLVTVGAIGGFMFSNGATNADAATSGVVNTTKMTSLYNSKGELVKNRSLAANTGWVFDKEIQVADKGSFYRVSTDEYVRTSDVEVENGNSDSSSDSVSNTGVATIAYAPSDGIDLYNGYGANKSASGQKLTNGTQWKFSQKVIDSNGNAWYLIGNNQWIDGTYTKINNESFPDSAANTWDPNFAAVRVTKDTEIYNNDNYGSGTAGSVSAGKLLQVSSTLQENDGIWYELSSGGWIPSAVTNQIATKRPAVSLNGKSKDQVIEDVISAAKDQLGKPYVWNAKGPDSFDCSGLMQYVFRQVTGDNIGSWTVPQESAGTKVSLNDLQRGDLVFWGPAGATYHVALYLGDNQYLNALRPGTNVKIDSISSSFAPSFGVRIFN
ncbi:C40 family peptidase [Companilactobacillus ginsenosidimutans]|uniref:Cell wall-associated glycoside hydrolase (NLP/P60 protein) n=1 Tax=Companilactobacillus ginsenosidimutans TaxID=1007676 RepID=A0A0H4QHM6_9LACO|nr:C40 family peptidase [Companilactobacillus ginsenosidimutans]AKP67452.1 cell wall-associated glycoside hydrolase (NLP/P60 protein) [Companilactobacillus ginsenosidimutans]